MSILRLARCLFLTLQDVYSSLLTVVELSYKPSSFQGRIYDSDSLIAIREMSIPWVQELFIPPLSLSLSLAISLRLFEAAYKTPVVRELFARCLFPALLDSYSQPCELFIPCISLSSSLDVSPRLVKASYKTSTLRELFTGCLFFSSTNAYFQFREMFIPCLSLSSNLAISHRLSKVTFKTPIVREQFMKCLFLTSLNRCQLITATDVQSTMGFYYRGHNGI